MTESEIDLVYRVSQHPAWLWDVGMLGVSVSSETVFSGGLSRKRCTRRGAKLVGFGPSLYDAYTVYLVWESIKRFNLPEYLLVTVVEGGVYKVGFKRGKNPTVILYSSVVEGRVAVRMWLWCVSRHVNV